MKKEMQKQVTPELEELVEVDEVLELDEEPGTTRPPDSITRPPAQTQGNSAACQPLEHLGQLCRDLQQVRAIEPPPKPVPAPRVHQRPSEGFD